MTELQKYGLCSKCNLHIYKTHIYADYNLIYFFIKVQQTLHYHKIKDSWQLFHASGFKGLSKDVFCI